jgi:hypothetical protein
MVLDLARARKNQPDRPEQAFICALNKHRTPQNFQNP